MDKEIIVSPHGKNYQATLEGNPKIVGYGGSPNEAIGQLIRNNREIFEIKVTYDREYTLSVA